MAYLDRRSFLKKTSLSGAALALGSLWPRSGLAQTERPARAQYLGGFVAPKLETIRAAFIGVGHRGKTHVEFFASLPGTEVVAISDLYEDEVQKAAERCKRPAAQGRHPNVALYHGDEERWRTMLAETKPDAVFISTNWRNHAPMAIASMEAGAHAFVEVPLATTLADLWAIVDTAERTQRHCMMMENVNYARDELMFLHMVRQGVVGELLHAEAAYIHELRWQMEEVERGTGSWRTFHYARRNGNLYPTHGLGPVAQYMNLARRDDTFRSLVSFSTPALGRQAYAQENYSADHQWNELNFRGGDLNTSILKTELGRTIMVQWDETSPRPYTRHNLIQGTKGVLAGFPTRVALQGGVEGLTEDHHRWVQGEQLEQLYEKYDHPLYKRLSEATQGSGHGGMDGMMMYRIVECLQQGLPLDQNVYEGALWSAVSPLSERSVAQGGSPQVFPDFTRGQWKETEPLAVVG